MTYTAFYHSPLGDLTLAGDVDALTGLWFADRCPCNRMSVREEVVFDSLVFRQVERWLDRYFAGIDPGVAPAVRMAGSEFQQVVWTLLREIPYGETITYGELARRVALSSGRVVPSAQAVGGAVGRNPVSIIVPCHRVVGVHGLVGYGGGIDRKAALLVMERTTAHDGNRPWGTQYLGK